MRSAASAVVAHFHPLRSARAEPPSPTQTSAGATPYQKISNATASGAPGLRAIPKALRTPIATPIEARPPAMMPNSLAEMFGTAAAPLSVRITPRCQTIGEV
jgi:hypothetical protein